MRKLFLVLTLFLLIATQGWCANRYVRATGGNYSAAGTWELTPGGGESVAVPTTSDDVFFPNAATLTVDNASAVAKTFDATSCTGTLTLASTNKLAVSGSITLVAGMTFAPTSTASGALTMAATGTLKTGGKLLSNFSVTGGTCTLGDNLDFSAVKTNIFSISTGATLDVATFTVLGNSVTNRFLLTSGTLGTPNSTGLANVAATTFNFVDLRDIKITTAGALDLTNGQVNSIGDCGGNTASGGALTFTTPSTQTWNGASGGAWSTNAWSTHVPLPQDTARFNGGQFSSGQSFTVDMPRLSSIDFTGMTWTGTAPIFAMGSSAVTAYGAHTFISGMSTTGSSTYTVESVTRSGTSLFTMNGINFIGAQLQPSMLGATFTLGSALTTNNAVVVTNGNFNDGGFNLTVTNFQSNVTTTRSITKTGNWSSSGTSTNAFRINKTNLTWSDTAGTITLSDTSATNKSFTTGGLAIYNLALPSGTGGTSIVDSNSFNRITAPSGGTITLTNATTQTITSRYGLANGTNVVTVVPSAGTATIAHQGTTAWDYVNLTNILYSGGTGYAGPLAHSTDGGGNTNWVFTQAPRGRMARFKGRTIGYPGVSRSGAFNAS